MSQPIVNNIQRSNYIMNNFSIKIMITVQLISSIVGQGVNNYYNQSLFYGTSFTTYTSSLFASKTFLEGAAVQSSFSTAEVNGDQNKGIWLELSKENGDIATDLYKMQSIYNGDQYISDREYYVNYTYTERRFPSIRQQSTYNPEYQDTYRIKCYMMLTNPTFQSQGAKNLSIQQLESYSFLTFALMEGNPGLFLLNFSGEGSLSINDIKPYMSTNINSTFYNQNYSQMWVINEEFSEYGMLVLQEEATNDLIFLNITMKLENSLQSNSNNTISGVTVEIDLYTRLKSELFNSLYITKIGISKGDIILGTLVNGLIILNSPNSDSNWTVKKTLSTYNYSTQVQVADFVILSKTIYIINRSIGMLIIDIESGYNFIDYVFIHPYLAKIDLVSNPFTGSHFVGVSTSAEVSGNGEFFIEFLVDDELNPLLNKAFTSGLPGQSDTYVTVDKFFSYFYNSKEDELLFIRRAMINSVPSESYAFNFTTQQINEYLSGSVQNANSLSLITIYDFASKTFNPAIYSASTIFIMNNITIPDVNLICSFQQGGNYTIQLYLHGEMCDKSLANSYQYTSCDKVVKVIVNILGDAAHQYLGLIISVCCVGIVIIVLFILILIYKTHCFKDKDFFKVQKEQLTRQQMYKEGGGLATEANDSPNVDNNQIGEGKLSQDNSNNAHLHKGEYQLGTVIDGKVFGTVLDDGSRDKSPEIHREVKTIRLVNTSKDIGKNSNPLDTNTKSDATAITPELHGNKIQSSNFVPNFDSNYIVMLKSQRTASRIGYRKKAKNTALSVHPKEADSITVIKKAQTVENKYTNEDTPGEDKAINKNVIIKEEEDINKEAAPENPEENTKQAENAVVEDFEEKDLFEDI